MSDDPKRPRRGTDDMRFARVPRAGDSEPAKPVVPPPRPVPRRPDDIEDMQLAPGDPFVRKAYNRVGKTTAQLGGALGDALREADGTDALNIQKLSKRSRAMSFQVQGVVWKAGFTKELGQSPLGSATPLTDLPLAEVQENGAIIRPVESGIEVVLRDLIPPALLTEADRMYGLTRTLIGVAVYFVPQQGGALAGLIAQYGDNPTSRRHFLFLQTSIRRPDPGVLDQMLSTFTAAVPTAQEGAIKRSQGDFWHELERAMYEVRATYRTSALHEGQEKIKAQLTTGLKATGEQVEKAMSIMDRTGEAVEWAVNLPVRGLVFLMGGISNALVWLIRSVDRLMRRR